uniref:Uncharacterized protein n=1 Tax=Oryza punctata TaxID=4537 RepID=A0A0E0L5A3_ORYPU
MAVWYPITRLFEIVVEVPKKRVRGMFEHKPSNCIDTQDLRPLKRRPPVTDMGDPVLVLMDAAANAFLTDTMDWAIFDPQDGSGTWLSMCILRSAFAKKRVRGMFEHKPSDCIDAQDLRPLKRRPPVTDMGDPVPILMGAAGNAFPTDTMDWAFFDPQDGSGPSAKPKHLHMMDID